MLLVGPENSAVERLADSFSAAGYNVVVAGSYAEGKRLLDVRPDLLISEVRLGEFNGLHLALRAQRDRIPAFVIGAADVDLEREARQIGAGYLDDTVDDDDVRIAVEQRIR
jgi:DNA-binding response OmpR family regulator